MEKEKEEYEKKALEVIQKATEENSEAQSKLQNLQVRSADEETVRFIHRKANVKFVCHQIM